MLTRPKLLSLAAIALYLAQPHVGQAQSAVKSGGKVRLGFYWALEKDCTASGKVVVSMIRDPQHGKLKIVEEPQYPKFVSSNPRSVCNGKSVPTTTVYYQAEPGFKGLDQLAFDVIFPLGKVRRVTRFVSVN